ncbi:hypothetical protein [Amycolatopsis sp. BJA-103]|uniref:hypothetical protein n=1 Tax=Amycolatopsis sp. BJA-103 TaxID=1911175 RepID=UPI000C78E577|nr:hypothetical protein [Amycolatopsis sp. BJA-103]AUI60399.1 hypothetical protein BKN51_20845 [Amycolatopsis sp. BJA-103]PNE16423.1 hypothetical protein B1H26_24470 [Amycolatopsis sp. BJA-103]
MSWSLSYQSARNPELTDALLLAAGKTLYLANAFEGKCKYVLKMFNFAETINADPVLTLEQVFASLPKDKMLGGTLQDIMQLSIGNDSSTAALLDKARRARNFVAHEGAAVGAIWLLRKQAVVQRASLLRSAVSDLAAGDNLVSSWCHEIDEREPAPQGLKADYPAMVDKWVFSSLDVALASVDLADDREPTLREQLNWRAEALASSRNQLKREAEEPDAPRRVGLGAERDRSVE